MKRIVLAGVVCLVLFVSFWLIGNSAAETEAAKTPATQPGKAKALLPGSQVSIGEIISNSQFAFAAVCEAINKSSGVMREMGVIRANQKFKTVELLIPKGPRSGEIRMGYMYFDIPDRRERAIKKGEQIIWLVSKREAPSYPKYEGRKALADTPQNRQSVLQAVDTFNKELRKLVREAISLPIRDARGPGKNDQNPSGLDFSGILDLAGQKADVDNFTKDHRLYKQKIRTLARFKKTWAFCALLNHPSVDVKTPAVRRLMYIKDPQSVPALLAAAKNNNYPVVGSENATVHSIFRRTLKKALQKITGLSLTPKGLKVTTYPKPSQPKVILSDDDPSYFKEEVDFKKVKDWLQSKFLSKRIPSATQPAPRPAEALPPEIVQSMKRLAEQAELIVLGKVVKIYDDTGKDGGMGYDVQIEKVFKGILKKQLLNFRSGGWVGYAKYGKGEQVLLFLRIWKGENQPPEWIQLKPVVYISSSTQPGALDISAVENVEELIATLLGATQPAEEWGKAIEAVQVRLRADKRVWKVGEVPTFQVDIRNGSIRPLYNSRPGNRTIHELEFDGHWYRDLAKVSSAMRVVQPGKEWTGIVVRLGRNWESLTKLVLAPGRHTVRVAFNGTLDDPKGADDTKLVRAVSNPVEIEIQAAAQAY